MCCYQSHHQGIETCVDIPPQYDISNYQSHHQGIETRKKVYSIAPCWGYQSHHQGIETRFFSSQPGGQNRLPIAPSRN